MSALLERPALADPARVLVCDDSGAARTAILRILAAEPGLCVVAQAADGQQALIAAARERPEIAVLDIEMPVLDGLAALPLLLRACPGLRVIVASTRTPRGAEVAMRALRLGAADYVHKPEAGALGAFRGELLAKIRGQMRLRRPVPTERSALRPAGALAPAIVAVGSSTGGPQALFALVAALGPDLPVPVVVTQHMPAGFTGILAAHLDRLGGPSCAEAEDGAALRPGRLLLAPGDRHLLVKGVPGALRARLSDAPPVHFCRPAVDPMFASTTRACGSGVLAVVLTGMGQDGLAGTREVVAAGGTALAQDAASSAVWGMPGAVAREGLCHAVLPPPALAARVRALLGLPA